jgi:hypothetical protein
MGLWPSPVDMQGDRTTQANALRIKVDARQAVAGSWRASARMHLATVEEIKIDLSN